MIKINECGIIFRNPLPSVVSVQAQAPGFCRLTNGEIICIYKRSPAVAAIEADYALARSKDGGITWTDEGVIRDRRQDDRPYSYGYGYPVQLGGKEIVISGYRWDRSHSDPDLNFYNPVTTGSVPSETILLRSRDGGRSWDPPQVVPPPAEVAMCNATNRILELKDGRLILPLESWKAWDDPGPVKQRSLVAFSQDGGKTWGDHTIAAMDPTYRILYWNGNFSRLADGRILAMYWCKDTQTELDLPVAATYSADEGRTWAPVYATSIVGQMGCTVDVGGGRVLAIYNRRDEKQPGVWATISPDGGRTWSPEHTCLWDALGRALFGSADASNRSRSLYDEGTIAFGKPDVIPLGGNRYLAGFWATSNFVMHLRYAHLTIE